MDSVPVRFPTRQAILTIAGKLNLPYSEAMQDWQIEVGSPEDVPRYLEFYQQLVDEDEKFVIGSCAKVERV